MINKNIYLNFFSEKKDKMIFSKAFDRSTEALKNKKSTFSDFLDPIKAASFYNIFKKDADLNIKIFGGYEEAERVVLGFSFIDILESEFPFDYIEVNYNNKYQKKLSHRDFLGAILGIGIKRELVGDILVFENKANFIVNKEISGYILTNLEKVNNATVKNKIIDKISIPSQDIIEKKITVSSLRLDGIISQSFNISRNKSNEFIDSEKAFINWTLTKNNSAKISENDILTIRGLGRIKILEISGISRSGRIIIKINKY